jgi:hypothetical protein
MLFLAERQPRTWPGSRLLGQMTLQFSTDDLRAINVIDMSGLSPIRKLLVDKHQDAYRLLRSAISNRKRRRVNQSHWATSRDGNPLERRIAIPDECPKPCSGADPGSE